MSDITIYVGDLLRTARKSKGLTQKEMGERVGITESAYSRYESGKQNLTLDTLQKVAEAMGVSVRIFID